MTVYRSRQERGQSRQGNVKALQFGARGAYNALMRDLVFIAVTVGFFALAALVVAACDRIVGPDPTDLTVGDQSPATDPELVAR